MGNNIVVSEGNNLNPFQEFLVPADSSWVRKSMHQAAECAKSANMIERHFLSAACAITAVAFSLFNTLSYLLQIPLQITLNVVRFDPEALICNFAQSVTDSVRSLLMGAFGITYVASGLIFPKTIHAFFKPAAAAAFEEALRQKEKELETFIQKSQKNVKEIQRLSTQLKKAQQKLETCSESTPLNSQEKDLLNAQIMRLKKEIKTAKQELSKEKNARIRQEAELGKRADNLEEKEKQLEKETTSFWKQKTDQEGLISKLKNQYTGLEQELKSAQEVKEGLRNQIQQLETRCKSLNDSLEKIAKTGNGGQQALEVLQQEKVVLNKDLENANQENQQVKTQCTNLQNELTKLKKTYEEETKKLKELNQKALATKEENQKKQLQEQTTSYQKKLKELETRVARLQETTISGLSLEKELKESKQSFNELSQSYSALYQQEQFQQGANHTLQQTNHTLQQTNHTLQQEKKASEDVVASKNKKIKELTEQFQKDKKSMQDNLADSKKKMEEMSVQLEQLTLRLNKAPLNGALTTDTTTLQEQQKQLEELKKAFTEKEEKLVQELEAAQKTKEVLSGEIEKFKKFEEEAKKNIKELEEINKVQKEAIENKNRTIEGLSKKVSVVDPNNNNTSNSSVSLAQMKEKINNQNFFFSKNALNEDKSLRTTSSNLISKGQLQKARVQVKPISNAVHGAIKERNEVQFTGQANFMTYLHDCFQEEKFTDDQAIDFDFQNGKIIKYVSNRTWFGKDNNQGRVLAAFKQLLRETYGSSMTYNVFEIYSNELKGMSSLTFGLMKRLIIGMAANVRTAELKKLFNDLKSPQEYTRLISTMIPKQEREIIIQFKTFEEIPPHHEALSLLLKAYRTFPMTSLGGNIERVSVLKLFNIDHKTPPNEGNSFSQYLHDVGFLCEAEIANEKIATDFPKTVDREKFRVSELFAKGYGYREVKKGQIAVQHNQQLFELVDQIDKQSDGLFVRLYAPINALGSKNSPLEVHLVTRGTQASPRSEASSASVQRDLEPEGVGKKAFDLRSADIIKMLENYLAKIEDKPVEIFLDGHSLGGCDVMRLAVLLAEYLQTRPDLKEKITKIHVSPHNPAALDALTNKKFNTEIKALEKLGYASGLFETQLILFSNDFVQSSPGVYLGAHETSPLVHTTIMAFQAPESFASGMFKGMAVHGASPCHYHSGIKFDIKFWDSKTNSIEVENILSNFENCSNSTVEFAKRFANNAISFFAYLNLLGRGEDSNNNHDINKSIIVQ